MAKWCRERRLFTPTWICNYADKIGAECTDEGRPDCPALAEMPREDGLLHRTWNEGSNWSREQPEMPRKESEDA